MFGLGKKKVGHAQFEGELEGLLSSYQDWQGGDNPDAAATLISRLTAFKRIIPDRKASERLSRALCDVFENQVKAMSQLAISSEKDSVLDAAKEYRVGQTYLERMNRAAIVLVRHIEMLEESDPLRQLLIKYGVYDPSGTE